MTKNDPKTRKLRVIIERNIRGMFQSEIEEGNDYDANDARDPTISQLYTLSVSPTSQAQSRGKESDGM